MLWHIGNTTVRTPYRLRQALIALQGTSLNGNLHGKEKENAFASLLHESEVVDVQRLEADPDSDVSDLGRKWRSALSQLGFITYNVPGELLTQASAGIPELSGRSFEITPNGYRLIRSEPITAQQECFLRSLLAYRIPSPIESRYDCSPFNPLKFVIDAMFELQALGSESSLSFAEFALFIQTTTPTDGVRAIAEQIIQFRQRKGNWTGNLRNFFRQEYRETVLKIHPEVPEEKIDTKAQTLDDYADLSFRYLKATGLFRSKGDGIALNSAKIEEANKIHEREETQYDDAAYLCNLWTGAQLPTDDEATAAQVVESLSRQIAAKGEAVEPVKPGEDISIKLFVLEERLLHLEEMEYYKNQAQQSEEISAWMKAFLEGSAKLPNGSTIRIPKGEAPAYLEWIIWRSFLAINSLQNAPWEARRFQVDQDFLPISTAPGGGPDMVFEFSDAIIVVEVTLTNSSRQEATEGESVRRHVAKYVEAQPSKGGKPVFGLFIAIDIDSNTAHTFRTGDWYLKDDSKINLQIVPLKLQDFCKLFQFGSNKLAKMPTILKEVIINCRVHANKEAPAWKQAISEIIDEIVTR
jgi:hypothetical protein